jgi:hypothetical protein
MNTFCICSFSQLENTWIVVLQYKFGYGYNYMYIYNYKCTYGYIDVIYEEYVDGNLAIYCQFIRQCIKSIHGAKYGVIYRQ